MAEAINSSKQKKTFSNHLARTWVVNTLFYSFFSLELRICLIQFECKNTLAETLSHLAEMVSKAVERHHPRVIALPECFYISYETTPSVLVNAAEPIPSGETCQTLSSLASTFGIYIVAGSIIERDNNNLHNTCTVWSPNGELIARHRKVSVFSHYILFKIEKKNSSVCVIATLQFQFTLRHSCNQLKGVFLHNLMFSGSFVRRSFWRWSWYWWSEHFNRGQWYNNVPCR